MRFAPAPIDSDRNGVALSPKPHQWPPWARPHLGKPGNAIFWSKTRSSGFLEIRVRLFAKPDE